MAESYYRLLGLDISAGDEQIRQAYKKVAAECHPDRDPSVAAAQRYQEVSTAFYVLKDESRRAKYDRLLRQATKKPSPAQPPTAPRDSPLKRAARAADQRELERQKKAQAQLERWLNQLHPRRNSDDEWRDAIPPLFSRAMSLVFAWSYYQQFETREFLLGITPPHSPPHFKLFVIIFACLLGASLLLIWKPRLMARFDQPYEAFIRARNPESLYWQSGWMLMLALPFLLRLVVMAMPG